jgi:hypothetical protein
MREYGSGTLNYTTNETGELNSKTDYHYPFNLKVINRFNKHHFSAYHREGDIPAQFEKYKVRHHHSITNDQNNLMNFNPTRGSEYTNFNNHVSMQHILYPKSKQRFLDINNRDTTIPDKIDAMRKGKNHHQAYPEHSSFLPIAKQR